MNRLPDKTPPTKGDLISKRLCPDHCFLTLLLQMLTVLRILMLAPHLDLVVLIPDMPMFCGSSSEGLRC